MSAADSELPLDPRLIEGLGWVRRARTEGLDATGARALATWRASDPAAEAAFAEAQDIGAMARAVAREMAAEAEAAKVVPFRRPTVAPLGVGMSRRTMIGSALAASSVGVLVIGQSTGVFGPGADLATRTGERRTVALGDGLKLTLDAESKANVARTDAGHRVDLLAGRAEIEAALNTGQVALVAGAGQVTAQVAKFEASLDDGQGCVTCLEGQVRLAHPGGALTLSARQQVLYDDATLGAPHAVDPAIVSSWRDGTLIFHRTPLVEVVRQVNRYREGRIMISRAEVGRHEVSGVFYIDRMERAVSQIEQITGARAISLPGGLVLLT